MGPKKGKGGGALELDTSVFSRDGVDYAKVDGDIEALQTTMTGDLAVVANQFKEWDIEGENWGAEIPAEEVLPLSYPSYIKSKGDPVAVKVHLGLEKDEPVDPKAKGKKDAKKGAPASDELTEPEADEEGNPLPRMFVPATMATNKCSWNFKRKWEPQQASLNADLDLIKQEIAEAQQKVTDAPEDEEAAAALKAAQDKESSFMALNKQLIAEPTGPYFDPCLVEAIGLVLRFGPGVARAKGTVFDDAHSAFPEGLRCLWENIYPKLPEGRPMYNRAGKYAVRLFLGGAWRRVGVTDAVPVSEGNVPSLQGSAEPLELWPTVLSKAIYTVFTACGYSHSMRDILPVECSEESAAVTVEDTLKSRRVATYSSFVVHMLTGWLPSSTWSMSGLLTKNPSQLATLVNEIVAGGAPKIAAGDIPSEEILVKDDEEGSVASRATDADGNPILKTKKQFKEQYAASKAHQEHMLSIIGSRETQISALDSSINSICKELFALCYIDDTGHTRVVPVLAVSPDAGGNLGSVKLLVSWQVEEGVVVKVEGVRIAPQTPVQMSWIKLNDLIAKNAFLFSFDSSITRVNQAVLPASWAPMEAAEDGKKGKGKGKGEQEVASKLAETGTLSPTLLQIARSLPPSVAEDAPAEGGEGEPPALVATKLPTELTLSIVIHADLPKPQPVPTEETAGDDASLASASEHSSGLLDDVIVVLREVRFDDAPPLILRAELNRDADLPLSRSTFSIPTASLYGSAEDPVLFWVGLTTRSSVQLIFRSESVISVGKAEEVWEALGKSVKVIEGESKPTPAQTEQVFCELNVAVPFTPPESAEAEDASELPHAADTVEAQNEQPRVLVSFHVPQKAMEPNITLVHALAHYEQKVAVDDSQILPSLDASLLEAAVQGQNSRIVGRCYDAVGSRPLPSFKWKAVFLCEKELTVDSRDIPEDKKRFRGYYVPNKELTLFEDVLSVDKTSFPLSLRLDLAPYTKPVPESAEGEEPGLPSDTAEVDAALKDVTLNVSMYRKSDGKKLHTYSGRKLIVAYSVPITGFLEDGEEAPTAGAADPKGKGKGGGAAPCDILITCKIDDTKTAVPDAWRSKLPYTYRATGEPTVTEPPGEGDAPALVLHDVPAVETQFCWQLDVLCGCVTGMTHDYRKLEAAVEEKNGWAAASDTRSSRAASASLYFAQKKVAPKVVLDGGDVKAEVFAHLTAALEEELPQAKVLEQLVTNGINYQEAIYGEPASLSCRPAAGEVLRHSDSVTGLTMTSIASEEELDTPNATKVVSDPYKDRGTRFREKERIDKENTAAYEAYIKFSEKKRELKAARVEALLRQAEGGDKLIMWDEREKYRHFAFEKNASLNALLSRAAEAKEDSVAIEEGKDPAKGKKKK